MVIAFLQNRQLAVLSCVQARNLRNQQPKTVYYPVLIEELESKKRRRGGYNGGGSNTLGPPVAKVFFMIETDAFFKNNLEKIKREYMPKDGKRNKASVR